MKNQNIKQEVEAKSEELLRKVAGFLVTTSLEELCEKRQKLKVLMVDGTVPGFQPSDSDYHFDHHKVGGSDVQIQEIPDGITDLSGHIVVTTRVDADACVAAAYCLLISEHPELLTDEIKGILLAISYDCDHLGVPDNLKRYADLAAKVVAAMKLKSKKLQQDWGLPKSRKEWDAGMVSRFNSQCFKEGVRRIIKGVLGGFWLEDEAEADEYFQILEMQISRVKEEGRISSVDDFLVFDQRGVDEYIDPRVWLKASNTGGKRPVTLTQRVRDGGYSYTIGVIPLHEDINLLDHCKHKLYAALTAAERAIDPAWDKNGNGWGGRATVGGSSWNSASNLTSKQIIEVVKASYKWK